MLHFGICKGQNLVPNWSFEDTVSCPTGGGAVNLAVGWSSFAHTPDYCNSCNTSFVSVPSNQWGYQYPKTGNAYIGLICYLSIVPDEREYVGIQLTQSLLIGERYYVSFYAAMAYNMQSQRFGIATNKLGIKMSTVSYSANIHAPTDNISQVYSNSVITDTLNWTKISGSFIADSAYQYIVIGNFFNDSLTTKISFDTNAWYADYYIDDIRMSTDSSFVNSINEINKFYFVKVYPNPFTDRIEIVNENNELTEVILYDLTSRNILQKKFSNSVSINTEQLAKGIYMYEVRNKNGVKRNGKVVKE